MNIVAIGGGDKTPAIQTTLDMLPTEHTDVLIVPTAASTETAYTRKVAATTQFFRDLGVASRVLHEFGTAPTPTRLAEELGRAAMIYTIGGNSPHMLKTMHEHGIDTALREAILAGKTHAGTSAGALLPFAKMHSNPSARPSQEEWGFTILDGLGVIPATVTAHANQHDPTPSGVRPDSRLENLQDNFPASTDYGFGIDNGAALILGQESHIIRALPNAQVHLVTKADGLVATQPLSEENLGLFEY